METGEMKIYVVEKRQRSLYECFSNVCAYTDYEKAKRFCDENNKEVQQMEDDYNRLEEEFGIIYDFANEEIFNHYLKGKDPELFEAYEKVIRTEGDLDSEGYATLYAYDDEFDSFLKSGEDVYRKAASECGYSDEVIRLMLVGLKYNDDLFFGEQWHVSEIPLTLYTDKAR